LVSGAILPKQEESDAAPSAGAGDARPVQLGPRQIDSDAKARIDEPIADEPRIGIRRSRPMRRAVALYLAGAMA